MMPPWQVSSRVVHSVWTMGEEEPLPGWSRRPPLSVSGAVMKILPLARTGVAAMTS